MEKHHAKTLFDCGLVSVGAMVYTTFREDFDALWETFSAWFCGRRSDWEELLAAANAAPMR